MDTLMSIVANSDVEVEPQFDKNSTPFRLLDLPIELVHEILAFVVAQPGPICLHPFPPTNSAAEKEARAQYTEPAQRTIDEPPVSRVNKFLRAESLALFYRVNDFHGMNWCEPRPGEWLKRIRREERREMRGLWISSSWSGGDLGSYFEGIGLGAGIQVEAVDAKEVKERLCCEAKGRLLRVRFPAV